MTLRILYEKLSHSRIRTNECLFNYVTANWRRTKVFFLNFIVQHKSCSFSFRLATVWSYIYFRLWFGTQCVLRPDDSVIPDAVFFEKLHHTWTENSLFSYSFCWTRFTFLFIFISLGPDMLKRSYIVSVTCEQ